MITITIRTDNEAFEADKGAEIARILAEIARDFARGTDKGTYNDINGNKVATVKES